MKRFLCTLICMCILCGVFATEAFAAQLNSEDVDWGLSLLVDSVIPTEMGFIMYQSGGNPTGDLQFGNAFRLDRLEDGVWTPVPYVTDRVRWTTEAYVLSENSITRWSASWENIYGELPHGHYRLAKEFMDFRDTGDYDKAEFYAEFVIADPHGCVSEDQDLLCDICMTLVDHECRNEDDDILCDICGSVYGWYRVVGNADWMGNWDPACEEGVMAAGVDGTYTKHFRNVPAGSYELKITKNGTWAESWGDNGNNYCFTLDQQMDIVIEFRIKDGIGVISVLGPTVDGLGELEDIQNQGPADTSDLSVLLPTAMLLICAAVLPLLLRKKNEIL